MLQDLSKGAAPNTVPSPPKLSGNKNDPRVVIGLDFGTSGTKVVVRIIQSTDAANLKTTQFYAIAFNGVENERTLTIPSALAVKNDQLFVGTSAITRDGAITSFKMCLPCQFPVRLNTNQAAFGNGGRCPRCQTTATATAGQFQLGGSFISAEEACTLYLAVVISKVREVVERFLGRLPSKWSVCTAAPLDQTWSRSGEPPLELRTAFERVLEVAFKFSHFSPEQSFVALLAAIRTELAKEMSRSDSRLTHVIAETHAAMTSFLLNPKNAGEKGVFCTVDIGAGTTDIAFFWANPMPPDEQGPWLGFYHGSTVEVGVDDIDRAVATRSGTTPASARRRREKTGFTIPGVDDTWKLLYERNRMHFQRSFGLAHGVSGGRGWIIDKPRELNVRVLFVGGGSQIPKLISPFQSPPHHGTPINGFFNSPDHFVPPQLDVLAESGARCRWEDFKSETGLLVLAHGLAHGRTEFPEAGMADLIRMPKEIDHGWDVPGDPFTK